MEIKKLALSLYATIFVIVLAIFGAYWFFSRSFATLIVKPVNAIVKIDDKIYKASASGLIKAVIEPGLHSVAIEAPGFIGRTYSLNFKRGNAKPYNIFLNEFPSAINIAKDGLFLTKGAGFNDGYFYDPAKKTLYRFKLTVSEKSGEIEITEMQAITDPKINDIREIIWSPSRDLALFRKGNGVINLFNFMKYDFLHQTETHWGNDIASIAWAPDNTEIAYYLQSPDGTRPLMLASHTNKETVRGTELKTIGIENPLLRWSPDSQKILLIPRSKDTAKNKVFSFDISARSTVELTENGNQTDALFSPNGEKILYSTATTTPAGSKSVISIMNSDGSDKKELNLSADISKIIWNKDSRHIIVASLNPNGEESIYRFDTENAEKTGFSLSNLGGASIQSLYLTEDEKIIVFQTDDGISALKIN